MRFEVPMLGPVLRKPCRVHRHGLWEARRNGEGSTFRRADIGLPVEI
jgi:hypothetical protein